MIGAERCDAFIGVDVGGTTIKAVAVDADGHVLARQVVPTFQDSRSAMDSVDLVVDGMLLAVRNAGYAPQAIGMCTPGTVDASAGVVAFAANLHWQDLQLAARLHARHGLPVQVDHDARAASSAEMRARGQVMATTTTLFVPLGTGVSAAILAQGSQLSGATGAAGELGHLIVRAGGELCSCGQRGCVEAYAGATALLRRYQDSGGRLSSVEELVSTISTDPLAASAWSDAIDALARGLHSAVALIDPGIIILGGGLSHAGERLIQPLRTSLQRLLAWRPAPVLSLSLLTSLGGIVGAVLLVAPHFTEQEISKLVGDLSQSTTTLTRPPSDSRL